MTRRATAALMLVLATLLAGCAGTTTPEAATVTVTAEPEVVTEVVTVAAEPEQSFDAEPETELSREVQVMILEISLDQLWDDFTPTQKSDLCRTWRRAPYAALNAYVDGFVEAGGLDNLDVSRRMVERVAEGYFDDKCY